MAPRASWKGYLKVSLVSCAVALFPATTTAERIRFNIINRRTGHRVHNQIVDAESGKPVEEEDRVRGYRLADGEYVLLEEEDFDRVALESTHTIDLETFVPRAAIDELYLDESYYLAPNHKASVEAFAVIREAMRKEEMVGLGRVVLYRRERILMLQPRGKGLLATIVRYHTEVRDEHRYFDGIPNVRIAPDMVELAVHILHSKAGHFDPAQFRDRYEHALTDLIAAKRTGNTPPEPPAPRPGNVISLMDALRRSVESERDKPRSSSRPRATKSRRRLAPISRRSASRRRRPVKQAG